MRYKKVSLKNNKWSKTRQALKELFETLHCSKCKNSLHDSQQFLQCGHFSCFSCTKNNNAKCIECQISTNDSILEDATIKKIVQACCTIAEQVSFGELDSNIGTTSKESIVTNKNLNSVTNNLDSCSNNINKDSNRSKEKPGRILRKRKGVKNLPEIDAKKAKFEKKLPLMRIPKIIEKKNHHGETKLQEACKRGNVEYVKILLDAGANPNTCCAAEWTPLQECADFGYIEIASLLLVKGADINKRGYQGRTPLHEAVLSNRLPMVKFCLEHNARKDIEDNDSKKPIDYSKSEHINMLLLCDAKNESPSSNRRFRNNNVSISKMCVNSPGIFKNIPNESHNSCATNNIKDENKCDSSDGESENNVGLYEERFSQNITIHHSQEIDAETFDSEEIDILN